MFRLRTPDGAQGDKSRLAVAAGGMGVVAAGGGAAAANDVNCAAVNMADVGRDNHWRHVL
jgi:hypothetical protein